MEIKTNKPMIAKKRNTRLPPKRGQIKIKMFKNLGGMEIKTNEPMIAKKKNIRLPPKRGQIKIKIFKKIGGAFMSMMIGCLGVHKDDYRGGFAGKPVVPFETTGRFKPGEGPID